MAKRPGSLPHVLYALALVPGRKYGSLEEQIVFLAEAFEQEGSLFLPLFLCPPETGDVAPFRMRGVEAECLDLEHFSFGTLRTLLRLLRRRKIEAIHWNFVSPLMNPYLWWTTFLAPECATCSRIIIRVRGRCREPARLCRLVKQWLFRRYAQVWGVSRFVRDRLASLVPASRLVCSLHFINTDRFVPDAEVRLRERKRLGVADRFVILAVANLIRDKGIDVAIRAMTLLPEEAVLLIAGSGPERSALEGLVRDLDLEGRVRLLGLQGRVEPLMQAADCFVCPSLWAEAAGLVNLEAQASGLPLVASDIGGIPEYVEAGRSGFLFAPGSAEALADHLRLLMEDADLRRRMGEEARAFAVRSFSPQRRLPDILDLYRRSKG